MKSGGWQVGGGFPLVPRVFVGTAVPAHFQLTACLNSVTWIGFQQCSEFCSAFMSRCESIPPRHRDAPE